MTYTAGYGAPVINALETRTAASHAAFFLPLLKPGMRVLDCGCGPGSITRDLAGVVAPGQVIGLDESDELLAVARETAVDAQVANVRFEQGSIVELPFADGTFDAVFAHAVLEHLADPGAAIREMRRVLAPGGVIGVRDADHGGVLLAPRTDDLDLALRLWERLWAYNGGDPLIGRKHRALLRHAGFQDIHASASFECCSIPPEVKAFADMMTYQFAESPNATRMIELGWADRPTLERLAAAWQSWAADPDAFFARPRCEAVSIRT